jgi:hypothetical protein
MEFLRSDDGTRIETTLAMLRLHLRCVDYVPIFRRR